MARYAYREPANMILTYDRANGNARDFAQLDQIDFLERRESSHPNFAERRFVEPLTMDRRSVRTPDNE